MQNDIDLLADRTFQQLSHEIVEGKLEPGAKLSEPVLSQRFGVSRGTLREAIRRLEERKLVTRSPRQGARVARIDQQAISEIMIIREALEGIAAREAALRITDAQILELKSMLSTHEAQLSHDEGKVFNQGGVDTDFHFAIAKITNNVSLQNLLCGEFYQLNRMYRLRHSIVPGRAQRALIEHRRIAEALFDRDPELAEIQMRKHIIASRHNLELTIPREPDGPTGG